MSLLQANLAGLGGSGAPGGALAGGVYSHELNQSLRFEDGKFTKTITSSGNGKTFTVSMWIKRTELGVSHDLIAAGYGSDGVFVWRIRSDDTMQLSSRYVNTNGANFQIARRSTRVFRDVGSWYHCVLAVDTTVANATSKFDYFKIYVNGEDITYDFTTVTNTEESVAATYNDTTRWNQANNKDQSIGYNQAFTTNYFAGYLAEIHSIDGTKLTADSFGETVDGVWVPKAYTGSYGTEGFYLPFSHDTVSEGFTPLIYTGDGVTNRPITGVGFKPDLVWVKSRSNAEDHCLSDSVRGAGKKLESNNTGQEDTTATAVISAFDNDGFTGPSSTPGNINVNGRTYVAWCWEAGGAPTVDNSASAGATPTAGSVKIDGSNSSSALAGSIAATRLSANTAKGFSIVTYTGTGSSATIAHGLSSAPEFIISKNRTDGGTTWAVYAKEAGNGYLELNTTTAYNSGTFGYNNTHPTSTVFTVDGSGLGASSKNYVSYCWHSVSGYSKFGSYTGSGSSGKAITGLGFRPVFVMIKRTDSAGGWHVFDSARFPKNPIDERIEWDNNDAENDAATVDIDFDSDGFTLKTSFDNMNASSGEYIYMAFADTRESVFSKDASGNLNNYIPGNIDIHDVVPDSPTNNFGTMNPLDKNSMTVSEGNLKVVPSGDYKAIRGTFGIPTSGKWYFEARYLTPGGGNVQDNQIGVVTASNVLTGSSPYPQAFTYGVGYLGLGQINRGGSAAQSSLTAVTAGKILGVAVNVDDDEVQFYLDGSAVGTAEQLVSTTEPNFAFYVGATNRGVVFNFGQDSTFAGATTAGGNADANGIGDFKYAPPSDHLALCASNLPDITIGPGQTNQADDFFETMLYTGTAQEQHIGAGGAQHPQDTTTIANSIRFEDGDNNYLTKSDQGTSSSDKQFTFSCWVKRGNKGSYNTILGTPEGGDREYFGFIDTNEFIYQVNNGTNLITTRKFLDVSNWYHIVVAVNINESTASDRQKIYINGEQITSFSSANYYGSSDTVQFMKNGAATFIGRLNTTNVNSFDGYMAEINFIDGSTLDPTYFGQVGANGYWIPKALSGLTYGTNGFRLTFENSSYLGYDYQTSDRSTNNDFTVSGLAATDQVIDSPTQNFSTMSPNRYSGIGTFSEGNLTVATSTNNRATYGTIAVPSSGKWYYEVRVDSYASGGGTYMGWGTNVAEGDNEYAADHGISFSSYNEQVLLDNSSQSGGYGSNGTNVASNGDVYSVLLDVDNGLFYYAKNGTYFNSANPSNGTGGLNVGYVLGGAATEIRPMLTRGGSYNETYTFNFGQDASFNGNETAPGTDKTDANGVGKFLYDVPTGFLALMDDNIPVEGIASPDFVWIKNRSATQAHNAFDTIRGAGKLLYPNLPNTEYTSSIHLNSFDPQGFSVGSATSANGSTNSMAAWTWKAGGISPTQTYTVKVVSDSGNKYRFDDFGTSAITLSLQEGGTYTFDQSDSSNATHPLRFSTTSDGTHNSGSEYTVGVTTSGTPGSSGAKTVITVAHGAPTLYYYCSSHSGMGGQANTTETHGSTNVKGSIQTITSANPTAGFSIIRWTGNQTNSTIGHGLTSAPEFVTVKNMDYNLANWYTWTKFTTNNKVLFLNATNSETQSAGAFVEGDMAATTVGVGTERVTNGSSEDMLAYCFHSVEGYSKVGSYIGNGNANGPFVYTGFRPAWLLMKNAGASQTWFLLDSERDTDNVAENYLSPSSSGAETTAATNKADFLSNGFKLRGSGSVTNQSGKTFIYLAFAEAPFKFANAR